MNRCALALDLGLVSLGGHLRAAWRWFVWGTAGPTGSRHTIRLMLQSNKHLTYTLVQD